jgi:Cytochrome b5-like Heme/Steroid binding domain
MKLVAACTTLVALPCSAFTFAPTLLPAAVAPTLRARSVVSRSLNMVSTLPEAPVITDPALAPAIKKPKGKRLHVQIEDGVYDLTAWRNKHPAGAHWIDQMEGRCVVVATLAYDVLDVAL